MCSGGKKECQPICLSSTASRVQEKVLVLLFLASLQYSCLVYSPNLQDQGDLMLEASSISLWITVGDHAAADD